MTTLAFANKTLEKQFRSFKWARNNTLQIFNVAQDHKLLDYQLPGIGQHTALYQFQCLIATTDTYRRRLLNTNNKQFGILDRKGVITAKAAIPEQDVKELLAEQTIELQTLFKDFTDQQFEIEAQLIQSIINHEYLHQGQLVVMFRQANVALPERFRKAFDL